MGWRIIEINSQDHLKLYLNNLVIKRLEKKIFINISDIDVLLLDNYKLNLSVQLINAITRNNGLIITFNNQHEPASYIYTIKGNHMSLKILAKQLEWTNTYKGNLWQEVIRNKIHNQYQHLLQNDFGDHIDNNFFQNALANVKKFDVTNREGHVAKVYWHILFGIKFTRDYDAKQYPVINSMLNYGYTVLRGMVIKSIVKKGLDARIALFHKSFSNFYALASDLMEPFRIIIDKVVYKHKDSPLFTFEIKEELIQSLTKQVYFKNKWEYVNNAIDKAIDQIIAGNGWQWVNIWK